MLSTALIVALVGILSLGLTGWFAHPDAPIRIMDEPNARSLHDMPTPCTGGLAICIALVVGWLLFQLTSQDDGIPEQILFGAVSMAGVSIIDDRYRLPQVLRLLVQVGVVLLLIRAGFVIQGELVPGLTLASGLVAIAATFIMMLWLINLYNFMDGMDGFAGGMAVIGFGSLTVLGWLQGDPLFSGAALAVSAAVAGFLWFNFPPARIFMGDTGSTMLGFLVSAFAIWSSQRDLAPIWLTLVIFSPFVVDATVTLLRRAFQGEPVWRAHRSHYYQRLVQLGWGHRKTVLVEYVVMLICSACALALLGRGVILQWIILAMLLFGYFGIAMAIHWMERVSKCVN